MPFRFCASILIQVLLFQAVSSQPKTAIAIKEDWKYAKESQAINSGIPWFDTKGNIVSAHGACIIKEKNKFYLFGENHSDTSNAFAGVNCYSSTNLYQWTFESLALPVQATGKLGPNSVGERPKVMKCPTTGSYIMYLHTDSLGYKNQFLGYAISKNIEGPYEFKGPILFEGKPIRKWDMGSFQDKDGTGYLLIHGGEIYRLGEDYTSIVEQTNKTMTAGFESPALFQKDSLYYFLGSNLTSWERNDNYYYTAKNLKGPWTYRGLFAPEASLTWNSQTSFVLPIMGTKTTTYLFMGDRWSYPKQHSAATYVWQPLNVSGHQISMPHFIPSWKVNSQTGEFTTEGELQGTILKSNTSQQIEYKGQWQQNTNLDSFSFKGSATKDDFFLAKFKGTGIGWYAVSGPNMGYASLKIINQDKEIVLDCLVDLYCKYTNSSLIFLSPKLPKGNYELLVKVLGEHSSWSDKRRSDYGSTGNTVSIDKLVVLQ